MAKRANPYSEDFVPQSKIYVGLKQFNNNEVRLKKVYEKTLDLLFKGSLKVPVTNNVITLNIFNDTDIPRKDKMKQLYIGKDGSLLHTGNMIEKKSLVKHCKCSSDGETQCTYCELVLCEACQYCCAKCVKTYCNQCMLLGNEGANVCVSCYN